MEKITNWSEVPWLTLIRIKDDEGMPEWTKKLSGKKAVFVGMARRGGIKVLVEDQSTSQLFSDEFWVIA